MESLRSPHSWALGNKLKVLFRFALICVLIVMAFLGGYKYKEESMTTGSYKIVVDNYKIMRDSSAHVAVTEMDVISDIHDLAMANKNSEVSTKICFYLKRKLKSVHRAHDVVFLDSQLETIKTAEEFIKREKCSFEKLT